MKIPRKSPNISDLLKKISLENLEKIVQEASKTEQEREYLHWNKLLYLTPPSGLTHEEWWLGIATQRLLGRREIPLMDDQGRPFSFIVPNTILEQLHQIDLGVDRSIGIPDLLVDPQLRPQFLVSSLMQEAIASSQLEGAATTREVAKEMLKSGRPPRDTNERMVLNNFLTMQELHEWKNRDLDENLVLEIHRHITEGTLDQPDAAGRLRRGEEPIAVVDGATQEILFQPPSAEELPQRLKAMCDFANAKTPDYFIHPIIRAILLHFWLAYDHPFVDGNGRTARALFYWAMLRQGYWFFEYLSISDIILQAPVQYGMAFLYTETDQNDLTYFILHQTQIIQRAFESLYRYIQIKEKEMILVENMLGQEEHLNPRQEALLAYAIRRPKAILTIEAHKNSHQIAYETARKDLQDLHARGLLEMRKRGKAFVFTATHCREK